MKKDCVFKKKKKEAFRLISEKDLLLILEGSEKMLKGLENIFSKSKIVFTDVEAEFIAKLCERIENGEKFRDIIKEVEKAIIYSLAQKYSTIRELSKVFGESLDNTKVILSRRKISLREIQKNKN